jgi:hypothetical protein
LKIDHFFQGFAPRLDVQPVALILAMFLAVRDMQFQLISVGVLTLWHLCLNQRIDYPAIIALNLMG